MEIEKIRQKTVVGQVMEKIKDLIASGRYKPGDKIPTEQELAEMFGIGRSSIREAIKIFNYLGVLESKAAKGTFLSESAKISAEALSWSILLGREEKINLVHIRGALELWGIVTLTKRYKADKASAETYVQQLDTEIENMRRGAELESSEILTKADYNFHNIVISSAENEIFDTIYLTLKNFMFEEIGMAHRGYESSELLIRDHVHILEAIRSGDTATAMETFTGHIENTIELMHRDQT